MKTTIKQTYKTLPFFMPKTGDIVTKYQLADMLKNGVWHEDRTNDISVWSQGHCVLLFKVVPLTPYYLEVREVF